MYWLLTTLQNISPAFQSFALISDRSLQKVIFGYPAVHFAVVRTTVLKVLWHHSLKFSGPEWESCS